MNNNNPKHKILPYNSTAEKVNYYLVNILRSCSNEEMRMIKENIDARLPNQPSDSGSIHILPYGGC
jgi:uncharacterized FlgJ-related protein